MMVILVRILPENNKIRMGRKPAHPTTLKDFNKRELVGWATRLPMLNYYYVSRQE